MSQPPCQVPPKELAGLTATMRFYADALGKDAVGVANRAARQTAIFTSAKIKRADPGEIDRDLAKTVQFATKKGKRLKRAKVKEATTVARAIVLARAKAKGEKLTWQESGKKALRMIAGRKKAAGFVKSGLIPALKTFGAKGQGAKGARQFGQPKGRAKKATAADPIAMLANDVQGDKGGLAAKLGAPALAEALREVDRDMRSYAEKALADRAASFNAGAPPGPGIDAAR